MLEEFLIYFLISLVILFFISIGFKNRKKVDERYMFNYFRLSYRRKMIRTVIMLPILALILFIVYLAADWDVIVIVILLSAHFLLSIIQLLYNYYQWKTKEKGTASAEERGFNQ